jgi:hypothetical protein
MSAIIWRMMSIILAFIFIMGCASSGGKGPEPKRLPDEWKYYGSQYDPDR